ncbi:MAG: hypothetical protein ACTH6S_04615 [Mesonia sp.]|uniref:hypothetical protein n=1 Tax=Mesonia sp. TaxID=1960830 RepID=UPI003F95FF40
MFELLPHRFKRIGMIIAPTGFFLWVIMQIGWITEISQFIGLLNPKILNVSSAILGFSAFLFGTYALTFSKEKIEDEMIRNVRLESFQFAALLQVVFLIIGLTWIGFMKKPPKDAGLMLFFIIAIFIFWIIYIIRFNYIFHIGIYKYEK